MPLALSRVAAVPDWAGLLRGLILAVDGEADLFELVGNVISNWAPVIFDTDDKNDADRLAVILLFAVYQRGP